MVVMIESDAVMQVQSHRDITTGLVTGKCVLIASCTGLVTGKCVVIASCAFTLYNHNECEPTSKCGYIEKVP